MEYLIYPLLGVIAGVIAGLLGVGGGIVIVPVLVFTFTKLGMADQVLTHMAVGTSLATIIVTSLGSVYQHHKNRAVRWDILRWFCIGLMLGAWGGAKIADAIYGRMLQIGFGVFAILISAQMILSWVPKGSGRLPGKAGLLGAGGLIGAISSIFGIGGGSLTVPFLTWCNVKMQQAIGTSSAAGVPIAVAGALGFLVTGWGNPLLPEWSLGYVYLPAFIGISVCSVVFARVGAHFSHRLPAATLKKCFAGLLIVVGIKLIVG